MALINSCTRGLFNQYIAGTAACLSLLATGACYGWMTPILSHLTSPDSEIPLTDSQLPWAASLLEAGCLFSSLPSGILINYIGRKPVLLSSFPVYILGWVIILYYRTALMLMVGRMVHGFALSILFTAAPVYLGEIASDKARGAITSMFFNSWWLGFLVVFSVGPFLDFYQFTYFTVALHVPFVCLFIWQPDSPYYYVMAKNEKKALAALAWFRDPSPQQIQDELETMKRNLEENKQSTGLREVMSTSVDRKALLILNVLTATRVLTGSGTLIVYATQLFEATPNLSVSPISATIAYGMVMFLSSCFSSFTIDRFGRRPLLMVSSVGSLLCHIVLGTYYYLLTDTSVDVSTYSLLVPLLVLLYSGLSTVGMYPVCSAYTSELFNTNTRGVASSIGSMNNTIVSFLVLLWYQPVTNMFGLYANFYIYAFFSLLGSIFFYYNAPETKGKPFELIREELANAKQSSEVYNSYDLISK